MQVYSLDFASQSRSGLRPKGSAYGAGEASGCARPNPRSPLGISRGCGSLPPAGPGAWGSLRGVKGSASPQSSPGPGCAGLRPPGWPLTPLRSNTARARWRVQGGSADGRVKGGGGGWRGPQPAGRGHGPPPESAAALDADRSAIASRGREQGFQAEGRPLLPEPVGGETRGSPEPRRGVLAKPAGRGASRATPRRGHF